MQTFLPSFDLEETARFLDDKRLNKQITEAMQIENAIIKHLNGRPAGWQSHTTAIMWYEHLPLLRAYRHRMAEEFTRRERNRHGAWCPLPTTDIIYPAWWGDPRITVSHRAMLYRKSPADYPAGWRDDSVLDYYWPWRDDVTNVPRNEVMKFPSGKAGSPELEDLQYPRLGSIKYDGSFCLVFDGELYSRNLILHPNRFLRERFDSVITLGQQRGLIFMGEIFDPTREFSEGQSITRSYAGDLGNTSLFVFDCMKMDAWLQQHGWVKYAIRYNIYRRAIEDLASEFVLPVYQESLTSLEQARIFYERALADGHEGIVTRDPDAYYKFGRCTARESDLFRHTEFARLDAVCLEVREGSERWEGVEAPKLLDGRAHRSFKQDDYQGAGTAGSLWVRDELGREYGVGFGRSWTAGRKLDLWRDRDQAIGRVVEIEYKPAGEKDMPRQPKLIRFRDDKDVER